MIDPEDPKTIMFDKKDVPLLPALQPYDFEEDERRRAAEAEWFREHMAYRPFGVEW